MSWSRTEVEMLIEAYKQHDCLYAVKSSAYHNKHARNAALKQIEDVLQKVRPDTTVIEIKTKFNALRSNFLVEYRKYKACLHSGMGEEEVYKPSLWYYELMEFLIEHAVVRTAVDSAIDGDLSITEDVLATLDNVEIEYVDEDPEQPSRKRIYSSSPLTTTSNRANIVETVNNVLDEVKRPPTKKISKSSASKRGNTNDVDVLNGIGNAVNMLATSVKPPTTVDKSETQICSDFVKSKLDKIKNEGSRLDAEQRITTILYQALRP